MSATPLHQYIYQGRKIGKPEGSYMDDLCAMRSCIVLCWRCQHKFDHARHHYYKDRKFDFVRGKCDGCRTFAMKAGFYVHGSFLTDEGGKTTHGQTWTPR